MTPQSWLEKAQQILRRQNDDHLAEAVPVDPDACICRPWASPLDCDPDCAICKLV